MKRLARAKKREYHKNGKSNKYKEIDQKFRFEKKKQRKQYLDEEVKAMKETRPGQYYHEIKKLGARSGECDDPDFSLPKHVELNPN